MVQCTWLKRIFAAAVAAVALANTASAGLLPVAVTVTPDSGNFRWTYAIVLPTDMKLQAGNYFTIYDFNGLVAGSQSAPSSDWTFSSSNTGPTPDRLKPTDDPTVANLTWTYTGATIPSGQIGLGNFWAISTSGQSVSASFTANTARTSDGQVDNNITETTVPNGNVVVTTTPEPMTLVLAGLGLPFVGVARLMRRRS